MTTISARIVADSVSKDGVRLTSFQLRYPRWIHSELMTHRAFSRNASSSRAIPISTMNQAIEADPALPLHIGKHQPGMQAYEQVTGLARRSTVALWHDVMRVALRASSEMVTLCEVAKQVANRVTEPFQHIDVVLTATDFENFFALRCHKAAEPHIRALAWRMADAYYGPDASPVLVPPGGWHLPYVLPEELASLDIETAKRCSVARCARVSYRTHDGAAPVVTKDLELYDRLMGPRPEWEPLHMSPAEHAATPAEDPKVYIGPLRGWRSHRKELPRECMTFNYQDAVDRGWRAEALAAVSADAA